MKIAMLLEEELQRDLFSPAAMEELNRLGEVVCNETGDRDEETIGKLLKGADIAISSWGTPRLTEEMLQNAPFLWRSSLSSHRLARLAVPTTSS